MPDLWLNEYEELGDLARSLEKEESIIIDEEKKDIISKMLNKSYLENQWNDKK